MTQRARYVVLATDAAPTYSVLAPVAVRLWRRLGYEALVFIHAEGWETPHGRVVLEELDAAGARTKVVPTIAPMSIANTMRCSRLVGAAHDGLDEDDFLLTSDVDMFPLSRTFFDRQEDLVVLRALGDTWMQPSAPKPPTFREGVALSEVRFPMCYAGALTSIWRELFPIVPGDAAESLRRTVEPHLGRRDHTDLDEHLVSWAFPRHPRANGLVRQVAVGVWRQEDLWLVDPVDAPRLSSHECMHRGMLWRADGWTPAQGPPPDGVIDFITERFEGRRPWWCFDVAAVFFPEEASWLGAYRARLEATP